MGGIFITGAKVYLANVLIENRLPETLIGSDFTDYQVYAFMSEISMNNCYFNFVSRDSDYVYYFNCSVANIGSCHSNSSEEDALEFTTSNGKAYNATINTHGHWGGSENTNYIS